MPKRDNKLWFGILVSIIFLYLLFRNIDVNSLLNALRTVDYRYTVLAIVFTFVSYFFRAVRWRYLLINVKDIPLSSLFPATIIGYMANNLLPARLGEFVRAYTLAQQEQLEVPSVLASLVIDRLLDGFTVMVLLVFTLFTLSFPAGMEDAALALKSGGVMMFLAYCAMVVLLLMLKQYTGRTVAFIEFLLKPLPQTISIRVLPLLNSFIGGISISGKLSHIAIVLLSSSAIWICCLMPVDMVLRAFGIHLPLTASLFILILLVFAVMVPASPGYIGTFHYACYKGLSVFGIPDSKSVSIALIMHSISFFPVIASGLYYYWKSRLTLSNMQKADIVR